MALRFAFGAASIAGTGDTLLPSPGDRNIADRFVVSEGFSEFESATSIPSISPALQDAGPDDLIVNYEGRWSPAGLTAVVLKPRTNAIVYDIPSPSKGADIYGFLKDHLDEAATRKAGRVRFPRNAVFEIVPPTKSGRHLKIEGFEDVVIDLNGSTLIFTQVSRGILIERCSRIVLRNGTLRGRALLASIARVLPDDTEAGIRFEVLPEFREALGKCDGGPQLFTIGSAERTADGSWRIKVDGYSELFVNRGRKTNNLHYSNGSFRATSRLDSNWKSVPEPQFVWLLHENNQGHGLVMDNEGGISDVTLEDLSFVNIPGMAIVGELVRGLHVNRVELRTDAEDPLSFLAVSSDGLHINANGGDIVIENSVFGPNGDDKITIKGNYWKVATLDREANTLTVAPVERSNSSTRWGWADDRVVFIGLDFSVIGEGSLAEDSIRESSKRHRLKLPAIPEAVQEGVLIGNVDNAGGRVVVRNNVLNGTRAQGILVQTRHMVVANNAFEGIAGPAIKLNLALRDWFEAIGVGSVLIADNTFFNCSLASVKSHDLIHFNQIDGNGNSVEIIDRIEIVGNELLEEREPHLRNRDP